jgi:2,5-dioxopentanoate dehydrogenase
VTRAVANPVFADPSSALAACASRLHARAERADRMERVAAALESRRDEIVALCAEETAYTPEELAPEFERTTRTWRMFAALVREGSWVRAAIDRPPNAGETAIGPPHDVRSMLVPLPGVVAVFGASNFPLAYGVAGGDSASAIAAGCPVVVKEHPAHPRTGRLIAEIVAAAYGLCTDAKLALTYMKHETSDLAPVRALVQHPRVAAVGFTGSVAGGLSIEKTARERPLPIPVFTEMGSPNPVLVLPKAFERRKEQIADALAQSVIARHGQQCTKPGIVLTIGAEARTWMAAALVQRFAGAPARRLLSRAVAENFYKGVEAAVKAGARASTTASDEDRQAMRSPLIVLDRGEFPRGVTHTPEEVFGPAISVGSADDINALISDEPGPGSLTVTLFADEDDLPPRGLLTADHLRRITHVGGRIIFNGVPTGVRVATGIVHGGPLFSSNAPATTAVGPRAIERWCRPVCFQNAPVSVLPDELRDENPLGIRRLVNGFPDRPSAP